MKSLYTLLAIFLFFACNGQESFSDSCFLSAAVGTSFLPSADLDNNNADLMSWNGSSWTGSWPAANLFTPPPDSLSGCRAIFTGSAISWTTGGEGFSVRLNQPLVSGQTYALTFTYVSDGLGSDGMYSPAIFSSSSSAVASGTNMGNLSPAGYTWLTSTFTFVATPGQNGDTWISLFTGPSGSSGMVNCFCPSCNITQTSQCSFTLGPDTVLCTGQQLILSAPAAATAYLWQDSSTNPTLAVSSPGTYWVQVTKGACISRDSVQVGSLPSPSLNLGNDTALCNAQTLVLNAGNPGSVYFWSDSSSAQTKTVSRPGFYAVTVTNPSGCVAKDTISVTQNLLSDSISATGGCGGNASATVNIVTGTGPFSYNWSNGGNLATDSNLLAGIYRVTVSATGGCTITDTVLIHSATFNDTITTDKIIMCSGDSAHICAVAGYASYQWNSGQTTPCFYTKNAGNYYVTIKDTNNCSAYSAHLAIAVHPAPPVSISINGDTLTVYNGVSYQWYFDNNPVPGATMHRYIAKGSGNYSVAVTDSNGCMELSNNAVITVGIEDLMFNDEVQIYPNPMDANGFQIHVSAHWLGSNLEILDDNGRIVYSSEIHAEKSEVKGRFAKGIYLIRIYKDQNLITRKLVNL